MTGKSGKNGDYDWIFKEKHGKARKVRGLSFMKDLSVHKGAERSESPAETVASGRGAVGLTLSFLFKCQAFYATKKTLRLKIKLQTQGLRFTMFYFLFPFFSRFNQGKSLCPKVRAEG